MKFINKIVSLIVTIIIIISCMVTTAFAKGTTLYFSKNNVDVGEKVTVTVSVNPDVAIDKLSFNLLYDSSVLKYEGGDGIGELDGSIKTDKSASGEKTVKYSFKFSAIASGKSQISVTDCIYKPSEESQEKTFTGAAAVMNVSDKELSSDCSLKSLKIKGYSLNEAFSSSKTSYTAKVPYDVKSVSIEALALNEKAEIKSIEGNKNLKVGQNTVTVTAQAEDGTQKQYKIKITREKEEKEENDEEEEKNETSSQSITTDITSLETVIEGETYSIATEIPKELLFEGFEIQTSNINGYTIETAVDSKESYTLFYLKAPDSDEFYPFTYDSELDSFEKLNYIFFNEKSYILEAIPEDVTYPQSLYASKYDFEEFSVDCLIDSNTEMSDFKYFYCYFNGKHDFYRYDSLEKTLQRYPDFTYISNQQSSERESFLNRFSSLSSNGKVIIVTLFIVVLGILALLILLIVYLIRRSIDIRSDIILYSDDEEDFDEVEIENTETENTEA